MSRCAGSDRWPASTPRNGRAEWQLLVDGACRRTPTLAAFVAAAASLIPGSHIALLDVAANPTRSGFVDALRLLGGRLRVIAKGDRAGREPVAELQVQSARARGGAMGGEIALRCGEGLAALAPLGAGSTRGLQLYDGDAFAPSDDPLWGELAALLGAFGVTATAAGAGLSVDAAPRLHAARIDARGDHRLAFTAVVCGLCADGETQVENASCLLSRNPRRGARAARARRANPRRGGRLMGRPIVVAIDGPAGAGKSTIARELARRLGYVLVDTGALYRGVALAARARGISWDDGQALGALAQTLDLRVRERTGRHAATAHRWGRLRREHPRPRYLDGGKPRVATPRSSSGATRYSAAAWPERRGRARGP